MTCNNKTEFNSSYNNSSHNQLLASFTSSAPPPAAGTNKTSRSTAYAHSSSDKQQGKPTSLQNFLG
jgi:hypothetical protein